VEIRGFYAFAWKLRSERGECVAFENIYCAYCTEAPIIYLQATRYLQIHSLYSRSGLISNIILELHFTMTPGISYTVFWDAPYFC
jgi:hypothetical protein